MICLFSTAVDKSTTDVYRWLRYLDRDAGVLRVNSDQPTRINAVHVSPESIAVEIDGRNIEISAITTVWYRKGHNWLCNVFPPLKMPAVPGLRAYLEKKLKVEESRLSEFVHTQIECRTRHLGSARGGDLNKLLVLQAAASCGLTIPSYLISTSTVAITAMLDQFEDAITKAISDGLYLFDHSVSSHGYYSYTEEISHDRLSDLPRSLAPSLIQQKIRKKFDVRVFYLDGECYAMAIFSQSDEKTKVDFRRYNDRHPNRAVPYTLPADVEKRLGALFALLGETTGSVDLVVDESDDHVFLEINPVGQFGMVSEPCNYYLERAVARKLLEYEYS